MLRKSFRDVHDYETIGHTKEDRAFSILFYRICYAIYFVFFVCFAILLFLVDILPLVSERAYNNHCIFKSYHFFYLNGFIGIICIQHFVKIIFYVWIIKQWKNKKVNPINNL